jgi:hypothetical protein
MESAAATVLDKPLDAAGAVAPVAPDERGFTCAGGGEGAAGAGASPEAKRQ